MAFPYISNRDLVDWLKERGWVMPPHVCSINLVADFGQEGRWETPLELKIDCYVMDERKHGTNADS